MHDDQVVVAMVTRYNLLQVFAAQLSLYLVNDRHNTTYCIQCYSQEHGTDNRTIFDSASRTVTTLATVIAVTHIACTARSLMNNFVTHGQHPCSVTPHYHLIITSF